MSLPYLSYQILPVITISEYLFSGTEKLSLSNHFHWKLGRIFRILLTIKLKNQVHQQVTKHLNVIGLVTQGVAEHLTDTGKLVLSVKAQNHAKETVKLGAFHALAEDEQVLGEHLFVFRIGHVHVAAQAMRGARDEFVFLYDAFDVFEHRFTFVRIDAE